MKKVPYNGLSKTERLSGHTEIGNLFEKGFSFFYYPFRVVTMVKPKTEPAPVQLMISVSKKNFRNATSRNRIKRIIRECFRLNKSIVAGRARENDVSVLIALIYTPKELPDFHQMKTRMTGLLTQLAEKISGQPAARKTREAENKNISEEHTENTDQTLLP